jgi:phage tail-like protein
MVQFPVNTHRFDPYKSFKFRVKWDGKYIPGITKITCLKRSTVPVVVRDGDDPSNSHLSPSTWNFEEYVEKYRKGQPEIHRSERLRLT